MKTPTLVERLEVELDQEAPELDPGSPKAIAQGCTCSIAKNRNGRGDVQPGGTIFYPDRKCPLHGIKAVMDR